MSAATKAIAAAVAASLLLTACGRPLYVDGKKYPTYGVANEATAKSKNVCYETSVGNIVWSLILVETLVMTAYFIGWSLYNPTRLKKGPDDDCSFDVAEVAASEKGAASA